MQIRFVHTLGYHNLALERGTSRVRSIDRNRADPQTVHRLRRHLETRPATTTMDGDTGLWFVPTGEILPAKKWSLSVYRVNFDRDQGFTDVSDWPLTFGFGAGDRAEIFGAWTLVRRVDRDVRPLFVSTEAGRGRAGQRGALHPPGLVGQSAGRSLARREDQSDVAVAAAAGGVRGARDAQGPDGEDRGRGRRQRQDGFRGRS